MWSVRRRIAYFVCGAILLAGCQQSAPDAPEDVGADSQPFTPTAAVIEKHDRGVALMGQFDYEAAHDVFDALATEFPDWVDVKIDLAIAKLNRRKETDAERSEELLDSVIASNPEKLRAKYCRAILLLYGAEPERALQLFKDVAAADPNDAYATYYAGQCLLDTRQYESALGYFEKAAKIDPYLRSAYYGAFQTQQRLKQIEAAKASLEMFQKLADNPQARSAEIKYSRMGPKAQAETVSADASARTEPSGPCFAEPQTLADDWNWAAADSGGRATATACDINADGAVDVFLSSATSTANEAARNLVLVQEGGSWRELPEHPLAAVERVNAALWGDFDNDSLVDVYLCRSGENQLWRQVAAGKWEDVTESTGTAAGELDTIDGALFDADHDGDLDLFVLNADGKNELLNNNLDGTFTAIGAAQGIAGGTATPVGLVVADLDSDRDADVIVLNSSGDHGVYLNDRLWNYSKAIGFDVFVKSTIFSAAAADTDADGQVELITLGDDGVQVWRANDTQEWRSTRVDTELKPGRGPVAVQDMNGDGRLDVILSTLKEVPRVSPADSDGWAVLDCFGSEPRTLFSADSEENTGWALVNTGAGTGFSVLDAASGQPRIWSPGPGRYAFADLKFTGKENKADQMRSNASGIGIRAAARVAGQWTSLQSFRDQSGPGQSRQPVPVGLRGHRAIDFVKLLWPDGLFQTELGLVAGQTHQVEETQRQVSSCPVLFVWNGTTHEFVSDVLGVGGLGFNGGRGEYHPPRPWENLMLPAGLPVATDEGTFRLKIGEPMEEACYLDSIRLVAYELPPGWKMTMDERQDTAAPQATGAPIFYRETITPTAATDDRGNDVLARIASADGEPVEPGARDPRFLAHSEPFFVTLEFAESLTDLSGRPVLVIDGWVEYPYSQTMFASWQAQASYDAPTLEARTAEGEWQVVYEKFGYPAGMPRQMSLPIAPDDLPAGTVALRISSSMEIYWDRMFIAVEEECEVKKTEFPLRRATVQEVGFPQRRNGAFQKPFYDYENRAPLWDARHTPGYYTNFGEATPLLTDVDDAIAIIGPGEEVEFEFASASESGELETRVYVLECHGWCKDMDLYTEHGESLEPLPRRGNIESNKQQEQSRQNLLKQFNQRFRAG